MKIFHLGAERRWRHLSEMDFWALGMVSPLVEINGENSFILEQRDICQRWTFGHLDWSRPRRPGGALDMVTLGQLQTPPLKVDAGGNVKEIEK